MPYGCFLVGGTGRLVAVTVKMDGANYKQIVEENHQSTGQKLQRTDLCVGGGFQKHTQSNFKDLKKICIVERKKMRQGQFTPSEFSQIKLVKFLDQFLNNSEDIEIYFQYISMVSQN